MLEDCVVRCCTDICCEMRLNSILVSIVALFCFYIFAICVIVAAKKKNRECKIIWNSRM